MPSRGMKHLTTLSGTAMRPTAMRSPGVLLPWALERAPRLHRVQIREGINPGSPSLGSYGWPVRDPALGWRACETLQILQHCLDQGSPARVFCGQCCCIEAENIAGLLRGFLAVRRRGPGEVRFQLVLTQAQGAFIGLHLGEQPAQFGC